VYSARAVNPSRIPPATSDPKDQHIYILAADGSRENEVVKTAGINKNAVWTPDGKHILFISDRSGKFGLWSIDVQEGKATGAASLVSADIGSVVGVGMAHGSYYYFVNALQGEYVHMVEVTLGGSAPAADAFSGIRPTWSPDGKSVAFKRHHPGSDGYDVVIHSLETGEEKTPLAGIGITGNGRPMWSHDGMSIMTGVKRGDGPSALTRVDLKTGEFKELHTILGVSALSLDGKTLYVAPESTPSRIVATDLDTGQERVVLASLPTRASIALSPDGRTLAIGWTERPAEGAKLRIARISVDGSGYRDLYTRTRTDHLRGAGTVVWDRDGRSILFDQQQPGEGGRWGVMRVPAEGGPATLVFATPGPMQSFDVSPDGSRFAYSANESANELWALDNVLTMLK
jgi:Tol biopolymer transport system component